jgi:hypothetical protein
MSTCAKLARKQEIGVSKPLRAAGVVVAGTLRTGLLTAKKVKNIGKKRSSMNTLNRSSDIS